MSLVCDVILVRMKVALLLRLNIVFVRKQEAAIPALGCGCPTRKAVGCLPHIASGLPHRRHRQLTDTHTQAIQRPLAHRGEVTNPRPTADATSRTDRNINCSVSSNETVYFYQLKLVRGDKIHQCSQYSLNIYQSGVRHNKARHQSHLYMCHLNV